LGKSNVEGQFSLRQLRRVRAMHLV
jgi:hypothetical protein